MVKLILIEIKNTVSIICALKSNNHYKYYENIAEYYKL